MKKLLLSAFVVIVFIVYSVHERKEQPDVPVVIPSSLNTNPQVGNQPTTAQAGSGYSDGTYTGSVADAFYGNVQVKATIANGKITNVEFLQYPNDRRDSIEINSQAMPALQQEAIQSQNAQVDTISGATQTSEAFRQSLQAALDQAKKS